MKKVGKIASPDAGSSRCIACSSSAGRTQFRGCCSDDAWAQPDKKRWEEGLKRVAKAKVPFANPFAAQVRAWGTLRRLELGATTLMSAFHPFLPLAMKSQVE
jgi:hypothetical protein